MNIGEATVLSCLSSLKCAGRQGKGVIPEDKKRQREMKERRQRPRG